MMNNEMFYAVRLMRKDGTTFLAHGPNSGPALFFQWKKAQAYRKELLAHKLRGRVIRIGVQWEGKTA